MIINGKKNNNQTTITKLLYKTKCYDDKASIAHQLNTHFINVGRELAEKLPQTNADPNKYIKGAFQNSFMFRGIYIHEVHDAIMGLKLNKSSIGIPQKFIKLACDYILCPCSRALYRTS